MAGTPLFKPLNLPTYFLVIRPAKRSSLLGYLLCFGLLPKSHDQGRLWSNPGLLLVTLRLRLLRAGWAQASARSSFARCRDRSPQRDRGSTCVWPSSSSSSTSTSTTNMPIVDSASISRRTVIYGLPILPQVSLARVEGCSATSSRIARRNGGMLSLAQRMARRTARASGPTATPPLTTCVNCFAKTRVSGLDR